MSAITGTVQTPSGDVDLQSLPLYVVIREAPEGGKQLAHVGGLAADDHDYVAGTLRRLAADADRQSRQQGGRR